MSPTTPKQLSRFVGYILGRHPEEFALVLDSDGATTVKTLLKVLHEEDGWRHVRDGHLKEVSLTLPEPDFEITGDRVRARDRSHLPLPGPTGTVPRVLFTAVRRKAHPHVVVRGLAGSIANPIVLFSDAEQARRWGTRSDRGTVMLTVNTAQAAQAGVGFWTAGEGVFTAAEIPVGCFTGPPLPKEVDAPPTGSRPPAVAPTPGSFIVDPGMIDFPGAGTAKAKKGEKKKRRREPPPWRR